VTSIPRSTWLSLVSTRETGGKKTAPIFPGTSSRLSVSRLFRVNFKPGLRNFRAGVHEKSAVKLRDF